MNQSIIIHFALTPILFVVSFMSVYLPKRFDAIFFILFVVSFISLSIVGFSASIRSKNFLHLFHIDPRKKFNAAVSTTLNGVEKIVLIYAVVIIVGIFVGIILTPMVGKLIQL